MAQNKIYEERDLNLQIDIVAQNKDLRRTRFKPPDRYHGTTKDSNEEQDSNLQIDIVA